METRWSIILVAVALLLPAVAMHASAAPCNPVPIGRCGAFDRENVTYCYDTLAYARDHIFVSGTETNVVTVGTAGLPPLPIALPEPAGSLVRGANVAYLRLAPAQAFAADPYNADLPTRSVWQESNSVPGLQMRSVTCSTFTWYAECNSWMGPYGSFVAQPDTLVA